jgi:hypothetical protein
MPDILVIERTAFSPNRWYNSSLVKRPSGRQYAIALMKAILTLPDGAAM